MCTVVIRVPDPTSGDPVRILAIRDEDPTRPWRPLGRWWPEHPEVTGIQDVLAGGAWLAATSGRLAVLLNRAGGNTVAPVASRGALVLGAVTGAPLPTPLTTLGFNLVEASATGVSVTSWEEGTPRITSLAPGTHMLAHDDVDDVTTARVVAWRDSFAAAATHADPWWDGWLRVLARSADVSPTDDAAIIRDNRPHGYPTLSLLVCAATIDSTGTTLDMAALDEPGRWNEVALSQPLGV